MTQITLNASYNQLTTTSSFAKVTKGSVGTHSVSFLFSSDWDGLIATAVFSNSNVEITKAITDKNAEIIIPWEVMATASKPVIVGIFGVNESGDLIIPTTWSRICNSVLDAPSTDGTPAADPTPSVYEQWVADIAADAASAAASAKITVNPAFIGDNGNWYVYSTDDGDYVDSGVQAQGEQGAKGDTGLQGAKGDTGVKGDTGEQGIQGERGIQGEQGDAFTYSDFTTAQLAALKGEKGDTGEQGIQGDTGAQGEKGDTGIQGAQGEKGDKGDKGDTGATGIQGEQGATGDDGVSIVSVTKTATDGLVDTYTITYSDNTTTTFNVTNGADGVDGQNGVDGAAGQDGATAIYSADEDTAITDSTTDPDNLYWFV